MITIESVEELRSLVRRARVEGKRIGFVPTMGYLHAGHIALVERVKSAADLVVASIFVNPTQFAPSEDLATYPRDIDGDRSKLEAAGCDIVFIPGVEAMYPEGFSTYVLVDGITARYEGALRPTHFRGVATVVAKLFNLVCPDVAAFGQKDAQQVAVIRRMIRDLNFGVELLVVETVREQDGLAMSSRNVYLTDDDREHAVTISRALFAARDAVVAGAAPRDAEKAMRRTLSPNISLDYADIVDADTFEPTTDPDAPLLAIVAGRVGRTRLIDNLPLDRPERR